MDVPRRADGQVQVPAEFWVTFLPAAQAIIVALAQRVVALEAEVRALKARVGQNSTNSSRRPSSDPPHVKRPPGAPASLSGRRAGGQPGHVGHFRALVPPERVDVIVDHWPERCVGCTTPFVASAMAQQDEAAYVAHQVTELLPVRAVVTEHRLHRVVCPGCGATTRATLPPDVPPGVFGPRLQATVATLSGRFRLSRREVAELCDTVLEAPLSVGSVDALCQATSAALAAPVAAVATLPQAPVVNADETPWKGGKARPWLWVAVTALVTVFQIATSRSSQVIKDLLGEDSRGTLGSDRYASYARLDVAFRQVCWAHLARDFQALVDRGGPAAPLMDAALDVAPAKPWFHGSPYELVELRPKSTVTQDRDLAKVFSHRPSLVSDSRDGGGRLTHNGRREGWLYVVDEPVREADIAPVPGSTMPGKEWHITRPLRVRLIERTTVLPDELMSRQTEDALRRRLEAAQHRSGTPDDLA
jgi:hypothetical protein